MTTVLVLLGAALCSMSLAIDADVHGEMKTWYFVAFATPEPWFESAKEQSKMGVLRWKLTKDGDMDAKFTSRNSDGTCTSEVVTGKKTKISGKFTYTNDGETTISTFQILDVASDKYGLVIFYETKGDQIVPTIKLFAHTQTASEEAKSEMKTRCDEFGILPDNIVYLPENDGC